MTTKPKRDKFVTRVVPLDTDEQRRKFIALAMNVPIDGDKPLEGLIRERAVVRGLDQNGLYWKRLGEIAEQGYFNGSRFIADTWHHYAGIHIMPDEVTTKDGEVRSKWVECPDGSMKIISTTQLDRICFAAYTTAVEAFGASLGVQFSASPREYGK